MFGGYANCAYPRVVLLPLFSLVNPEGSTSDEWLQLPLHIVEAYLVSDDLEVRSEQVVLDACLSWVAHEPENRISHLPSLLRLVRLNTLSPALLRTYVDSNASIVTVGCG